MRIARDELAAIDRNCGVECKAMRIGVDTPDRGDRSSVTMSGMSGSWNIQTLCTRKNNHLRGCEMLNVRRAITSAIPIPGFTRHAVSGETPKLFAATLARTRAGERRSPKSCFGGEVLGPSLSRPSHRSKCRHGCGLSCPDRTVRTFLAAIEAGDTESANEMLANGA